MKKLSIKTSWTAMSPLLKLVIVAALILVIFALSYSARGCVKHLMEERQAQNG
jgi:hypothetical protein